MNGDGAAHSVVAPLSMIWSVPAPSDSGSCLESHLKIDQSWFAESVAGLLLECSWPLDRNTCGAEIATANRQHPLEHPGVILCETDAAPREAENSGGLANRFWGYPAALPQRSAWGPTSWLIDNVAVCHPPPTAL